MDVLTYRQDRGLTQVGLAKQTGVPQRTIASIELGAIPNAWTAYLLIKGSRGRIALEDLVRDRLRRQVA